MGVVYEAVQMSLGRHVALKVLPFAAALDPRQLQRFKNEAQAAAHLHHTNIVPVHGVGCDRGVHYYAMQLIEGQVNLANLIDGLRPRKRAESAPAQAPADTVAAALSTQRTTHPGNYFRTIARLAAQAAEALEHAHQFGVIHRDVKPANLIVDAGGHLWVTDFGLAQFHTGAGLTRTGDLLGTLRYVSPEQAAGKGVPSDPRTDVYSLGATLYELLTLQPMFDGNDHRSLLRQIIEDEPRPPRAVMRSVPQELETIVLKAVTKNLGGSATPRPRNSPTTCSRFVSDRPILAQRPTLPQRLGRWLRRHPSVVGAAVVLLLLVAAGSLVSAALVRASYQRERQRAEEAEAQFKLAQRAVDELILVSEEELADDPHQENVRRRLLESALGYYQEFIDRRRDNPAAQGGVHRAHARRCRRSSPTLAVLRGAGQVHHVLEQESVLDDLNVSGEQRRAVEAAYTVNLPRSRGDGEVSPVPPAVVGGTPQTLCRTSALRRVGRRGRPHAGAGSPSAADCAAIKGIRCFPLFRRRCFVEADSGATPAYPDDRKRDVQRPQGGEASRQKGPPGRPPDESRKDQELKTKEALRRVLALLTPEQVQQWQKLTGEPFRGSQPFPPRPGAPPRS